MTHMFCYIDPGSGSLFFQALISGAVTLLLYFNKVKNYLKAKLSTKKSNDNIEI